jgi:transposase
LHKKTLQIEIQNPDGNVISNSKVQNTPATIRRAFAAIPQGARCVIESSSVWYEVFRFIRDDLGYEVILSNPAQTKAIASSKKKTDKVDAHILADLLRGGYITESHVPDKAVIESRQMVRFRHDKVEQRTQCKNVIHGILLQDAVRIGGSSFSNAYPPRKRPTRSTRTSWPICSGEDTSQNRTCRTRQSSSQGSW